MALNLEEHRLYLQDKERISAYRAAIGSIVKPGQTVVDLASGTGILGLLACEAGARRVYAIEESGLSNLAREFTAANGCRGRIQVIRANTFRATLPERVDVAVTDQMGRLGFEAGVVQLVDDARKRFLKPDGVTIPSVIEIEVAPVKCAEIAARLEFWRSRPRGFEYAPVLEGAHNTGYPITYRPDDLLGAPAVVARLEPGAAAGHSVAGRVTIPIGTAGVLDGIGGWFTAHLAPAVTLTNSPLSVHAINRRQVFFPLGRPVPVAAGDVVAVEMRIMPANLIVAWRVNVLGHDLISRADFSHSTLHGMLMTGASLGRLRADYVPRLDRWGEARRTVVNLCDGMRRLADVEDEIYRSCPQLFSGPEQAAEFVAEVVTRYGMSAASEAAAQSSSPRPYAAPRLVACRGFAALTPRREPFEDREVFGIAPQED